MKQKGFTIIEVMIVIAIIGIIAAAIFGGKAASICSKKANDKTEIKLVGEK